MGDEELPPRHRPRKEVKVEYRIRSLQDEKTRAYEVAMALTGFPSRQVTFTAEELNQKHKTHFEGHPIPYEMWHYAALDDFLKDFPIFFRPVEGTNLYTIIRFPYKGYRRRFHIPSVFHGECIDLEPPPPPPKKNSAGGICTLNVKREVVNDGYGDVAPANLRGVKAEPVDPSYGDIPKSGRVVVKKEIEDAGYGAQKKVSVKQEPVDNSYEAATNTTSTSSSAAGNAARAAATVKKQYPKKAVPSPASPTHSPPPEEPPQPEFNGYEECVEQDSNGVFENPEDYNRSEGDEALDRQRRDAREIFPDDELSEGSDIFKETPVLPAQNEDPQDIRVRLRHCVQELFGEAAHQDVTHKYLQLYGITFMEDLKKSWGSVDLFSFKVHAEGYVLLTCLGKEWFYEEWSDNHPFTKQKEIGGEEENPSQEEEEGNVTKELSPQKHPFTEQKETGPSQEEEENVTKKQTLQESRQGIQSEDTQAARVPSFTSVDGMRYMNGSSSSTQSPPISPSSSASSSTVSSATVPSMNGSNGSAKKSAPESHQKPEKGVIGPRLIPQKKKKVEEVKKRENTPLRRSSRLQDQKKDEPKEKKGGRKASEVPPVDENSREWGPARFPTTLTDEEREFTEKQLKIVTSLKQCFERKQVTCFTESKMLHEYQFLHKKSFNDDCIAVFGTCCVSRLLELIKGDVYIEKKQGALMFCLREEERTRDRAVTRASRRDRSRDDRRRRPMSPVRDRGRRRSRSWSSRMWNNRRSPSHTDRSSRATCTTSSTSSLSRSRSHDRRSRSRRAVSRRRRSRSRSRSRDRRRSRSRSRDRNNNRARTRRPQNRRRRRSSSRATFDSCSP